MLVYEECFNAFQIAMLVYEEYFNAGVSFYISHIAIFTFATVQNSQLNNFLPLYAVLLIYNKVKASQILHGGTIPVVPSKNWIKAFYSADHKNISCLSYLLGGKKNHKKNHAYLTVSQ